MYEIGYIVDHLGTTLQLLVMTSDRRHIFKTKIFNKNQIIDQICKTQLTIPINTT